MSQIQTVGCCRSSLPWQVYAHQDYKLELVHPPLLLLLEKAHMGQKERDRRRCSWQLVDWYLT